MKNWRIPVRLLEQAGGDGGDGGGGTGGTGGSTGGLSDDAMKMVDERVNKAVSTHLSRFRTSFEKDLNKSFTTLLTPLSEKLEAALKPKEPVEDPTKPKKDEVDARFTELKQQSEARIKALEEENRKSQAEAAQSEAKRRQDEEKAALASVLADQGITGARQRAAMSLLYTEDKRVVREDDGAILFVVPRSGYTDKVKLDEGVKEWLNTDDGKAFMPPRVAGGSGAKGSPAPGRSGGKETREQRQARAKHDLAVALGVLPAE